jgi:hypothetical protein
MTVDEKVSTGADERTTAVALYNGTWELLDRTERTPDEIDRMIHMAHASRYHWDNCGNDQNRTIGEWQVSRVYAELGRGEPAVFHALRAIDYANRDGVADWLPASAHEALARAYAAAGDLAAAHVARDKALALTEEIGDDEDKAIVLGDIQSLPIR